MYVHSIIKSVIEKNIEKALQSINEVLEEGKDLENFLWEMIKHTKDILMYKVSKKVELYNDEEVKEIAEVAENVSKDELINIVYKLSELENKMKMTSQKTIIFETEVIKLCMKIETPTQSIQPQKTYETPKVQTNTYTQSSPVPVQATAEKTEQKQTISQKEIKPVKLAPGQVIPGWQTVISNLKSQGKLMIYTNLIGTEAIEINDMTVAIRFNNGLNAFRKSVLEKPENMSVLTKEISVICGKPMQIKLEDAAGNGSASTAKTASIKTEIPKAQVQTTKEEPDSLEDLGIDINFIEEE